MMEICDWTSETVVSASDRLEVCEWSDEASSQLPKTTRKRTYSEFDQNSCSEEETNTWNEVDWSVSCSSLENVSFSAAAQLANRSLSPPATDLTIHSFVSSLNSSPRPSGTRCETPVISVNSDQDTSTSVPIRRSPRLLKYRKTSINGRFLNNFTEEKWQLFSVMKLNGCAEGCATNIHGLSEFDILHAHARFCSKSSHQEKRQ